MQRLIRYLRGTLLTGDEAGEADGQLLERFVSARDLPALDRLVRRHAPMVWGVCRRVLSNSQDAEDAFQATFLVLVRRAAIITPREHVANWLYGVAYQTALKARATRAKRKRREGQVSDMPEPAVTDRERWDDLRPILDEELSRLPDKYRVLIVSSDLEGKTRAELARELGLAEGTVASRLARGRALLAARLSSRGVALSGTVLAAVLGQNVVTAGVPPTSLAATLAAVSELAIGGVVTSASSSAAVALAEEVVRSASASKLSIVGTGVLGTALLVGAAGLALATAQSDPPPAQVPSTPLTSARVADVPSLTDREKLRGRWKAVRVRVGDETVTFGAGEGPDYTFTADRLTVTDDRGETDAPAAPGSRPGRFRGPGGPAAGLDPEHRLLLARQFGGRGGPWAGLGPEQRQLLAAHLVTDSDGRVGIDFEVRWDERAKSIDRVLSVDGVEKLVVRGVYALAADKLVIWDAAPMTDRPTARQVETGAGCTTWTFKRVTTR